MNNKEYYTQLAQRYFEAETTLAEERELMAFLAADDDPVFDELRAVMYMCRVLAKPKRKSVSYKPIRWISAAAVLLLLALSGVHKYYQDMSKEKLVEQQLAEMFDNGDYSADAQMWEMFNQ